MAAESLRLGAKKMGHRISVEMQGKVGPSAELTDDEIEKADVVILAVDRPVDRSRFEGKPICKTSTYQATLEPIEVIERACDLAQPR
jgi:PTS system fructose-specific IIC component